MVDLRSFTLVMSEQVAARMERFRRILEHRGAEATPPPPSSKEIIGAREVQREFREDLAQYGEVRQDDAS